MKKVRIISVFVTLALSIILFSCGNPNSSGNNSSSTNNGGLNTSTSEDNTGSSPTNSDNPEGSGGITNPPAPKYEWINTKYECFQEAHQEGYDSVYTSTSDYNYLYYNTNFDYSRISIGVTNQNNTINGEATQTETQGKSILTYYLSNNIITYNLSNYSKDNESWILASDLILETDQESGFNKKQISHTYNNNVVVNETIYEYSIELLSNDGETKRYKQIQTNQTPTIYSIREIKNGKCQKSQTYNMNDVLQSELIYFISNNETFNERLPDFYLSTQKIYNNGNLYSEYSQQITIITFDENKLVFEIAYSTNTTTNFQKFKYTYEKKQIPFSN